MIDASIVIEFWLNGSLKKLTVYSKTITGTTSDDASLSNCAR